MRFRKQKKQPSLRQRPANSARPKSFAYYGQRSTSLNDASRQMHRDEVPRRRQLSLRFVGQRFGALLAVLAALLLLITSLQVSMRPRVQILNADSAYQLHSADTYETTAEKLLKRSWTNTNKITINTAQIARDLQLEYPELADASMTLPLVGQRPILYLQLTEPQLTLATTEGRAFVLDENGRALVALNQLDNPDRLELPTITDESGLEVRVGAITLSSSDVGFIKSVLYQLEQKQIAIGRLVLPAHSRQFDVYLHDKPYYIKFNLQDGRPKQQVGTFLAVQTELQGKGVTPAQYIDVRLLGRAYYK